ncbi:cytochrome C1 heme lyase [Amylostereum chailletii]|nr:cytochrome C1 heme lyase [Amylostereum chailletii]
MSEACPIDHSASKPSCPIDHSNPPSEAEVCPVDHTTRSKWSSLAHSSDALDPHPTNAPAPLSKAREVSSIPRVNNENWVYPSEAQFFSAMARKNHNPHASDMRVVVPIHNAVNERAWDDILRWESGRGGDACGGVRLVSFKGRPRDMTPKARFLSLLGYTPPFDRHDWVVDRCGTRVRYVIDFYTGRSPLPGSTSLSFYLDARPALDNWEGVKMRTSRLFDEWASTFRQTFSTPPSAKSQS